MTISIDGLELDCRVCLTRARSGYVNPGDSIGIRHDHPNVTPAIIATHGKENLTELLKQDGVTHLAISYKHAEKASSSGRVALCQVELNLKGFDAVHDFMTQLKRL